MPLTGFKPRSSGIGSAVSCHNCNYFCHANVRQNKIFEVRGNQTLINCLFSNDEIGEMWDFRFPTIMLLLEYPTLKQLYEIGSTSKDDWMQLFQLKPKMTRWQKIQRRRTKLRKENVADSSSWRRSGRRRWRPSWSLKTWRRRRSFCRICDRSGRIKKHRSDRQQIPGRRQ